MLRATQINFLKALKKIDAWFQSQKSNLHSVKRPLMLLESLIQLINRRIEEYYSQICTLR